MDELLKLTNVDAENALLSELIFFGTRAYAKITDKVAPSDFSGVTRRNIFLAASSLCAENEISAIDLIALDDRMKKLGFPSNLVTLSELMENPVCRVPAYEVHAEVVHDYAEKRHLKDVLDSMCRHFAENYQNSSSVNLRTDIELLLADDNSSFTGVEVENALAVANDLIKSIQQQEEINRILPTGISSLDVKIEGLRSGTLNIIGARPGCGKSALGANIICNMLMNHTITKPALIFSLEMGNKQVVLRMLSSFTGLSVSRILSNDSLPWGPMIKSVTDAFTFGDPKNKTPRLLLCDRSNLTLPDLKRITRQCASANGGLGCLMLDYVQLMPVEDKGGTRASAIGEISRTLKELSRTYQMPVIALCQLNRGIEQRQSKEPVSSDIKDSGSIEQDADLIMLITREGSESTIHITKNRNGTAPETVQLHFNGNGCRFEDLSIENRGFY